MHITTDIPHFWRQTGQNILQKLENLEKKSWIINSLYQILALSEEIKMGSTPEQLQLNSIFWLEGLSMTESEKQVRRDLNFVSSGVVLLSCKKRLNGRENVKIWPFHCGAFKNRSDNFGNRFWRPLPCSGQTWNYGLKDRVLGSGIPSAILRSQSLSQHKLV